MAHTFQGTYLVTGASQGIGLEIARLLAKRGCEVLLLSRSEAKLKKAQTELQNFSPKIDIFPCDLRNPQAIKNTALKVRKKYPTLHGIINNAGFSYPGYFIELPPEVFVEMIETDYLGSVLLTRELIDLVPEGGLVSFTSSVVGFMGVFGFSAYAPAKFALLGLAETLRQELYFRNIQVSVLCPPDTDTPGYEEENKIKPKETKELSKGAKLLKAHEVADVFLRKVEKGKFLITCNLESSFLYHFHRLFPNLMFRLMIFLLKKYRK